MKNLLLLFCLLPFWAAAQSVTVPNTLDFAGLHLRFTNGGRQAVQQKVDALRRYQPSFQARVDLADAYFPLIDRVFQAEGLPLDFHYLALQESGLQGDAQSIHDAVGYWQFKRESATELGVQVNDVVDERKHIVVSSHGAAKYFQRNNAVLHNWLNALLSYNLGLSGTKPYTLPTDYDATEMEITEQTHPYVLTFLAHKIAFEPAVGQNPKPPLLLQEFPAVGGLPLATIATGLQTEPDALARHNHWLQAGAKVPTDRPYTILVPITDPIQLTAMAAQQKTATKGQLLQPQTDPENVAFVRVNGLRALVALPGDTKESLARRAGLKLRRFMRFNDLLAFDNIAEGQPYFVEKKRDKATVAYHAAQPGETVATVSQKYGVRARAILNKNRMARNEELRPGRILWLQHTRPREVAVEYAPSDNTKALAAFERPAAPSASPVAPTPQPTPVKAADPKPYTSPVATPNRPAEPQDSTATTSAAADSTADAAMENLNDLPPAPATPPTAPSAAKPGGLYAGRPVTSQPQPAPSGATAPDSTQTASTPTPTPAAAPAPTTEPVIKAPASVVLREPAPTATKPSKPVAPATAAAPVPIRSAPATAAAPAATEALPANGLYVVQKSESLYGIGRRYGLRPADLAAWNELPANSPLRLGQTLRLTAPTATVPTATAAAQPASPVSSPRPAASATTPAAAPTSTTPSAAPIRHTVAAGESMYGISRKYGVTIKQIMEWNNKPDFNVRPGEVLTIVLPK